MRKLHWLVLSAVLMVGIAGCGKSTNQGEAAAHRDVASSAGKSDGPAAAAHDFLDAVRTGNDEKARSLLSTVAREKTAALNRSVTPAASDTATFTVGKVEHVNQDGARVSCTWSDIDEDGERVTDTAIWVLRLEDGGWRICGVAAQIFPGEPPLLLNFEDPDDMLRKQQWAHEEMQRRIEAESQPRTPENAEKPDGAMTR